jgi:sulfur-oxidizing protein SoxX
MLPNKSWLRMLSFALTLGATGAWADSQPSAIDQGREIAFDRQKGNCLACHMIEGGSLPGTIAPPLISMKKRYPDKSKLRAQIWDATQANPNTVMPPFGKHRILNDKEVDLIAEFVHSL